MDDRLKSIIYDYQNAVSKSIGILESNNIKRPASPIDWVSDRTFSGMGEFKDGTKYFKHGFGCSIKTPDFSVDFDFGDNGEINGFDLSRLENFTKGKLHNYSISNSEELNSLFSMACKTTELIFSGYILWYLSES